MLRKFKNLPDFLKKEKAWIDISSIQTDLTNGLFKVMEKSFEQRRSDLNNSRYTPEDVQKIINYYSKRNIALAAASSVIPGPLGILGSIPELLLNFHNQMNMIYDLSCANGKENFINKDILLEIPIAAFGGNTNLTKLQHSGKDLIDSPEEILLEKAFSLGQALVDRTLKKSIVQFLPVAGPILMGTWAKMTTNKISKSSLLFLSDQHLYEENSKPDENEEVKQQLQTEKIKALVNLIESNNEINENQINLISTIISNSDLTHSEKEYYLEEALKTGSKLQLNKQIIQEYEEEEDLILQLVIMAKRSGNIDDLEKNYIYEVGDHLEIENQLIDDLFKDDKDIE